MPPEREIGARDRGGRALRARPNAATGKPASAETRERESPLSPYPAPLFGRKADGTGRPESTARLLIGRTPNALQAFPGSRTASRERQGASDAVHGFEKARRLPPLRKASCQSATPECAEKRRHAPSPAPRMGHGPSHRDTPPIVRPNAAPCPIHAPPGLRPAGGRGNPPLRGPAPGGHQPGRPVPPLFPPRPVANHYLWHCPPGHAKPPGQQG